MTIRQGLNVIAGGGSGVPTGSIVPFAGSTAPEGYLLCDGSAISRTTYSALFSVIGTTYGEGDGNTTFNIPDLVFVLKSIKGNGMTLGMTDGNVSSGLGSSSSMLISVYNEGYGNSIGTTITSGAAIAGDKSLGITLNATKSGIESEINSNIKYAIKY